MYNLLDLIRNALCLMRTSLRGLWGAVSRHLCACSRKAELGLCRVPDLSLPASTRRTLRGWKTMRRRTWGGWRWKRM